MRIKLSLLPPFTQSKILLPIPEDIKTISNLKRHLLKSLSTLSQHVENHKELTLEIDGFELLPGSTVVDVIQDNDVVCVRLSAGSSRVIVADKTQADVGGDNKKKRRAQSTPGEGVNKRMKTSKSRELRSESLSKLREHRHSTQESHRGPQTSRGILDSAKGDAKKKKTKSSCGPNTNGDAIAPTKTLLPTTSLSSSSSASSSHSSTSSSSSDSSSDSDTDSDSDSSFTSSSSSSPSSSSSSSSPSPSVHTSTTKIPVDQPNSKPHNPPSLHSALFPVIPQPKQPSQPPVPPHQGNHQTHARNLRRKKARQMKKLAASSAIPHSPADHTDQSVVNEHVSVVTLTGLELLRMLGEEKDIANRNKKKGFLKEMKGLKPTRIVFGSAGNDEPLEGGAANPATPTRAQRSGVTINGNINGTTIDGVQPAADHSTNSGPSTKTQPRARLIPPSELETLPSNVFITTAEFPWVQQGKRKQDLIQEDEGSAEENEINVEAHNYPAKEVDHIPEILEKSDGNVQPDWELDWEAIEDGFDGLSDVSPWTSDPLPVGSIVAWKDLELDLHTFSPALKLKIGRVIVSDDDLKLENLKRPIAEEEIWEQEDGREDDQNKEIVITLAQQVQNPGRWKVVY